MDKFLKALPFIAIGLGVVLVVLIVLKSAAAPTKVANVHSVYGTQTGSGIPWYDQYQENFQPTEAVRAINANPGPYGYTYTGAIAPSPICDRCQDGKCNCNVNDLCGNIAGDTSGCGASKRGCMDSSAVNYDANATCPCVGCCVATKYGCLRRDNIAFNPWANTHDERFCSNVYVERGCTSRGSINRSNTATVDNGLCVPMKVGCVDANALNYDTNANVPCEGCCIPKVSGCTQLTAPNFQIGANVDDGSCITASAVAPLQQQALSQPSAVCGVSAVGSVVPDNAACAASFQHPQLGAVQNCGSPWDLRTNSIGATQY